MSAGVSSGVSTGTPAGTSNKGKSPIMEVDPPVKRRTFRQMEEDRLGEEAAKRLFKEEHADLERQRAEMQRKRQQDVLDSAKYYTDADWTDIMGQVHANQGLTSDLLGPDVNEDNFAERMVALMLKEKKILSPQRKDGIPCNQEKSLGTMKKSSTCIGLGMLLTIHHQKFFSDDDSDDDDDLKFFCLPCASFWEEVPTPLGRNQCVYMNGYYVSKYFTHLGNSSLVIARILLSSNGMVVNYYEDHPLPGAWYKLWVIFKYLFESHKGDMFPWYGLINNNGISGLETIFHFPMSFIGEPFLAKVMKVPTGRVKSSLLDSLTPQGRTQPTSATHDSQQVSNVAPKPTIPNTNSNTGQPSMAQKPQPVYLVQPTNMGYVYFHTGPSSFPMQPSQQMSLPAHQQQVSAQPQAFGPTGPFQPAQLGSPMPLAQQGPPGPIPSTAASQF
ncbi:hypothetical protein Tco_0454832 [Tanacetum coccineum]